MLLDHPDPVRIGDFGVVGAVHHIQRINRRAGLRVNTRQRDQNIFAIKVAQHVVEHSEPVRSLNLNERVGRMRFVIDGDSRRKFDYWRETTALAFRLFD